MLSPAGIPIRPYDFSGPLKQELVTAMAGDLSPAGIPFGRYVFNAKAPYVPPTIYATGTRPDLVSGPATISEEITQTITGTGALVSQSSLMGGAGTSGPTGSGDLVTTVASISGSGSIDPDIIASGDIAAQPADITGTGLVTAVAPQPADTIIDTIGVALASGRIDATFATGGITITLEMNTVTELSSLQATLTPYNEAGASFTPASMRYKVYDVTNDETPLDWTSVTPADSVVVWIPGTVHTVASESRRERRELILHAVDGSGNDFYSSRPYEVQNVKGVDS